MPVPGAGLDVDLPLSLHCPSLLPPFSRCGGGGGMAPTAGCGAGGSLDGSLSSAPGGGAAAPPTPFLPASSLRAKPLLVAPAGQAACPPRRLPIGLLWLPCAGAVRRSRPTVLVALGPGPSQPPVHVSRCCNQVCATFRMTGPETCCLRPQGAPTHEWPSWPYLQQFATPCRGSKHRRHEGTPWTISCAAFSVWG